VKTGNAFARWAPCGSSSSSGNCSSRSSCSTATVCARRLGQAALFVSVAVS
jgi:hypothetical protein